MKSRMLVGGISVGLVALATSAFSTPIVQEDWTTADVNGWAVFQDPVVVGIPYGTLANPGGPGTAGSLGITGGASAIGPRDFINTTGGGFADNYGTLGVRGISFDFYVDPIADVPSSLQLYFVGNGNIWFYDVSSQLATGWNTLGANFDSSTPTDPTFGSWYQAPEFGVGGAWTTDIASVTRIGLELSYLSGIGSQVYGIDNFTLDSDSFLVPEPETYLVLGIALMSVAFVFRKRITDSLDQARSMLQS